MSIYCSSIVGTSTLYDRKNGANGGQSISIASTGWKESAGTTAVVAGDLVNMYILCGSGHSDAVTVRNSGIALDDGGANQPYEFSNCNGASWSNQAGYAALAGIEAPQTAPGEVSITFALASTISQFGFYVSTNTFVSSSTWYVYHWNTVAYPNISISVGSGVTGWRMDSVNSDSVSAGDWVCWGKGFSGGAGSVTVYGCGVMSACEVHHVGIFRNVVTNFGTTIYGAWNSAFMADEAASQNTLGTGDKFCNLEAWIPVNTCNGASTADVRVNGSSPVGGPAVSIPATSTGLKHDSTAIDIISTDAVNFRLAVGGTSGSVSLRSMTIQQKQVVVAFPHSFGCIQGV